MVGRIVLLAITATILLVVSELLFRHRYPSDLRLVRDVDHRLPANTAETNSDGIRSQKEAGEFTDDALNIIFLGDSFVYGERQYPELALPQQYERLVRSRQSACKTNVANFGWVTSSPYLSLRLLKEIGIKYSPDVVFLFLDMTDFHDDLKYRYLIEKPTVVYKALAYLPGIVIFGKKRFASLSRFGWGACLHDAIFGLPSDRFFIVNEPLSDTEGYGSAVFRSIIEIAEFSENELGSKFVLIVFPRSFQYSERECPENWEKPAYEVLGPHSLEPFVLIEKFKERVGFPVHSLLRDFQDTQTFPTVQYDDPHWTEKGHRFVAERLYAISEEEGLLGCDGVPDSEAESTTLQRCR